MGALVFVIALVLLIVYTLYRIAALSIRATEEEDV